MPDAVSPIGATPSPDSMERSFRDLADGTALQMAHLFSGGQGYISKMNRWTGRYELADHPCRSDDVGFAVGRLLLCYLGTGDERFLEWATAIVDGVAETVEMGLKSSLGPANMATYYGLCWGANITGNIRWSQAALRAVREQIAEKWSPSHGRFMSRQSNLVVAEGLAWQVPMLAWAARIDGDLVPYLLTTLDRTLEIGFVREDGSTNHIAEFDAENRLIRFTTHQGYSDDSTWARGHAWCMHGFLVGWEATGDQRFLDIVRKMADWWISRTSEERIPFYDFDDPAVFDIPRCSCSAAIAADVMFRLARATAGSGATSAYARAASATVAELVRNHMSPGGVLLHGSSGRIGQSAFGRPSSRLQPDRAPQGASVLTHRFPMEEVMPFGNMFVASALYRQDFAEWSSIDIKKV